MPAHLGQPALRLELLGDHRERTYVERGERPPEVRGVVRRAAHHVDVLGGPPPEGHLPLHGPEPGTGVGERTVHHALRPCRGARRVEHELGAAAGVGRGEWRGRLDALLVVATDPERAGRMLLERLAELAVGSESAHGNRHVGISQDIGELPGPEMPVDRQEGRAEHAGGNRHLQDFDAVGHHTRDRTSRTGAALAKDRRQPRCPRVELTVGTDPLAEDDRRSVGSRSGVRRHSSNRVRRWHRLRGYRPTTPRTAAASRSAEGNTNPSRAAAEPIGAKRAPTRRTGASSSPKSSSLMTAATSAPNPPNCVA